MNKNNIKPNPDPTPTLSIRPAYTSYFRRLRPGINTLKIGLNVFLNGKVKNPTSKTATYTPTPLLTLSKVGAYFIAYIIRKIKKQRSE